MTVTVTNTPPDFLFPPTLSPSSYQLHVMDTLNISLPPLYDLEGGKIELLPKDTPDVGSSTLVLMHDSVN